MKIGPNADLGKGRANDAELLMLVSSTNIACKSHMGDAQTIQACACEAIKNGTVVSTHPSFPDRENFGRSVMQLPSETVFAQTLYQTGALTAVARAWGGIMYHIKPHGVLHNRVAKETQLTDVITRAIYAYDPASILVGLTGSGLIRAGERYGLVTCKKVFADRGYQTDGSLVPWNQPSTLVKNEEQALAQTLEMVQYGRTENIAGKWTMVTAQMVYLHGDGEYALAFTRRLRATFVEGGVIVAT